MNKVISVVAGIPALFFIVIGLRWIFAPMGVAPEFGMPVLTGVGLSTQIGDLSAFFLTGGICVLLGIFTQQRSWFYAAAMLVALTAIARTLAWLLHDASLAIDMIGAEIILTALWLFAASKVAHSKSVE